MSSSKTIDAAIVIGIFTGLLYFSGYIYELHFLDRLSAPCLLFMPNTPSMILSGWLTVLERTKWILLFLLLIAIILGLSIRFQKIKSLISTLQNRSLILDLLFILSLSIIIFFSSRDLGRNQAEKQLAISPHTMFEFKLQKMDGYYKPIRYVNGNYLLLNKERSLVIVSQNQVKKITFKPLNNEKNN